MPLLFDKKNNQVVDVADNLVNDALASGNYRFRQGVRVPVIAPDGTEGTVLSDELPELIPSGFKYLTREEGKQRATEQVEQIKEETYGDSTGLALAAGALRGATFGLSDAALASVGLSEALYETKKRNETASMVGEIGGSLASALTPYGLVGGVTKGATAAGQAFAKAVGRTNAAGTLTRAGRIVSAGAGLGAEGAVVGAGQTISELAMQDPTLTAEKAIANVGMGALFGAGLGAIGRGAFEAADVGISKTLKKMSETEAIPKTAEKLLGKIGSVYARASGIMRGEFKADPQFMKLYNPGNEDFQKAVFKHMSDPDKLYKQITSNFDVVRDFTDDLRKKTNAIANLQKDIIDEEIGLATTKGTKELIGKTLQGAEKKAGLDIIEKAKNKALSLADEIEEMAKAFKAKNIEAGGSVFQPGAINYLNVVKDKIRSSVSEGKTLGEIAEIIVGAKNELADRSGALSKNLDFIKTTNRTEYDTMMALRPMWKRLKEASVDTDIFGDIGTALGKRANILSDLTDATKQFDKNFFEYVDIGKGRKERQADYEKIANFFKNTELPSKEKKRRALSMFQEMADEAINKLEPISNQKILDGLSVAKKQLKQAQREGNQEAIEYLTGKIGRLESHNQKIAKFNEEIKETIEAARKNKTAFGEALDISKEQQAAVLGLNQKEYFTGRILQNSILGGAAGTLAEGVLGREESQNLWATGAIIGAALGNPRAAFKFLTQAKMAARGLDKAARKSAVRFRNISKKAAQERALLPGVITATRQTTIRENLKLESDDRSKSNEGAFLQHKKDLEKMASDQVQLYERVYDSIGPEGAEENPELTQAMYETTARGIAFLQTKIPKDSIENPLVPESDYTPSFAELDKYSRYVKAVKNPKQIFRELEAGDIQPETVEALRMVYPKVYDTVVTSVAMELADGKEIPFDARVQMATLLGMPAVKPLTPAYIQTLAQIGQVSQEGQGQPQASNGSLNRSQLVSMREMDQSGRQQRER